MRLLFLSLAPPLPADNGMKLRNLAILRALTSAGHKVAVVSFGSPEECRETPPELEKLASEIHLIPLSVTPASAGRDYRSRIACLWQSLPYSVGRFRSETMRETLASMLEWGNFDAVWCESAYPMINVLECPVPLILDNHNVEHELIRRYMRHERNPAKWLYAATEWGKMLRWERRAYRRADIVLACSDQDRQAIARECDRPVFVAPNVVAVDEYPNQPDPCGLTVMFTGGMDWLPNRDAVEYFAARVWPELRRFVPDVRWVVAGRNPAPDFLRKFQASPGIEFTGTVDDMREEIARATVCVVPLRIGSGTRLKILEAAAMNRPVVSTTLGAEGLNFANGEEILLEDDPSKFARAVANLLLDPSLRRTIARGGRLRVEKSYSLRALTGAIRDALDRVACRAPHLVGGSAA